MISLRKQKGRRRGLISVTAGVCPKEGNFINQLRKEGKDAIDSVANATHRFGGVFFASVVSAQVCINCHKKVTPNFVTDWQLSKHSKNKVDCSEYHGNEHKSAHQRRK